MTDKQNNEVEAWCVKDPNDDLIYWTTSTCKNGCLEFYAHNINNGTISVEEHKEAGCKVVKVKITEVQE